MVGIFGRFKVFESAQGLAYGKPHPEVYMNAASKLGVEPSKCMAIEDSLSGTISAKAAGMKVISIPFDYPEHKRGFQVADKILGSLAEINDSVWNQIWSNTRSKL